jgi:hypothetical protein
MHKLGCLLVLVVGCSKSADPKPVDPPAAENPAASTGSAHHRKHQDRRESVVADAPPLTLNVVSNGTQVTWHQDSFDKVARYTKGTDGEARDVWSLRDLVHQLAGPTAWVTSVTGGDGTKSIEHAAWDDTTRTPLLHTTRRGTLKFRWADGAGTWGESEVKDVTRIEIAQ